MRLPLFVLLCAVLLTGCGSQRQLAQYRETISDQGRQLDSLYSSHRELQREYAIVLDTLQFYDDVETGRIYRQIRSLNDRINRLEYDLSISLDGGVTLATISADDLFEPASTTLTPGGAERLADLLETLNEKYGGRTIRIEGHSDSVPVGGSLKEKYPSNWELSTARAASVARYFVEQQKVDETRLEVVGYGSVRPIASNATAQGRSQNRRIRIAVMPSPQEPATAAAERR